MIDLTKSYEFFKPELLKGRIHIIGCGSVGSTVAENIARFGISDMVLYDFDTVEARNVVNQLFTQEDIGRLKTEALADHIRRIDPDCRVKLVNTGWNGQKLAGYVFLCCDTIELRQKIVDENLQNRYIKGMFDFRTRLTDAQHYAADWSDWKSVKDFRSSMNFTHEEAASETPVSACNIPLSVAPTIRIIAAYGVANFINFIKGTSLKKMILADAFAFTVDAF